MTNDLNAPTESNTLSKRKCRPEWADIWMQMADVIAQRSRCDRAKVGCVIVDEDKNILAAAYNGPAPEWRPAENVLTTCTDWCPRARGEGGTTPDYSNCPSNHAEINAISRMTPTTKETLAYINRMCCNTCAKALAAAGVSAVICQTTDLDEHIDTVQIEQYFEDCDIFFWRYSAPAR